MYSNYVKKRNPVAAWILDDTAPFFECSGAATAGEVKPGSAAPATSAPLVAGAVYSSVFKQGSVGRFPCNLFRAGQESRSFSIEAWVLPIPKTTTGDQQILSHDGQFDGLSISGKVIRFGTAYLTAGTAYCDFDLGEYKLAHVVGKHNADQNELWVNGELVATVDITDVQKADSYVATDSYLYVGDTTSSQQIAINGVAFYPAISGDDIRRNYKAGIEFIGQDRISPQYGGTSFDLAADSGAVFIRDSWLDKTDFERGLKDNVVFAPDQIEPAYIAGVSQAGSWTTAIPLDGMGDTSIYGVMVAWSSNSATVDVSLDGTAWSPAVSGRLVSIIPNGFDPTGTDLHIRVNFAGGLAEDPAYLESLIAVGFRNNTVNNISARTITVTHPAVLRDDFETNLYRDDNGISLAGGTLTIGTDTTLDPDIARTLEFWIKPLSGVPAVWFAGGGATVYRNGSIGSSMPVGEWSLMHFVAPSDITGSITVTGDAIIGQATLYPTPFTATDVSNIWKSYIGTQVIRFTDTQTIGVSESAIPAAIYTHDWAIDGAG